jgi:hypothetical protein
MTEENPLWFLVRNPRAYGEVKNWLKAKKVEFAKRYNADGGSDAEYISYSSEMALFDELLKDLQAQMDLNFPPLNNQKGIEKQ